MLAVLILVVLASRVVMLAFFANKSVNIPETTESKSVSKLLVVTSSNTGLAVKE